MESWEIGLFVLVFVAFGVSVYFFIQVPKRESNPVGTLAPFITFPGTTFADDSTKQYCTTIKYKGQKLPDVKKCSPKPQDIPNNCKVISDRKFEVILECDTPVFTPSRTPLPSFSPSRTPTLQPFKTSPTTPKVGV
jgi:hypothetical protein